ncbi:MAG: SRPBCC family protein [Gemmatimonadaceae bacterium]
MTAAASSTDRIEKQIVLPAPRSRVWRAITDAQQFGEWFGVRLETPFAPGAEVSGSITHKGYEHVTFTAWVEAMEPERLFSFRWHPHAIEQGVDYSQEPTTLVTFTLEDAEGGTRLMVVESGFDAIPAHRRVRAFEGNARGWAGQMESIRKYLARPAA